MTNNSIYLRLLSPLALLAMAFPASVQASFDLGQAANYAAIAGQNTTHFTISGNSTVSGNIATNNSTTTAGGNYVAFSSGTINGNFDFTGTAQNNLGGGTLTGTKDSNVPAVGSAYTTISNLSALFSGEAGNTFTSLGVINAESGKQDSSSNYVFTATTSTFLQRGSVVINGSASDYVVINVGNTTSDNNSLTIANSLTLTGGITADHVFINVLTTGKVFDAALNAGTLTGVVTVLNSAVTVDNTSLAGRVIGGGSADFQFINGSLVTSPGVVPEPASIAMVILAGGMFGGLAAVRRRRVKAAHTTA
jgi:hypothetical protein